MKTTYKRWGISIILSMMLLLIPFFVGPQMQSYAAQKWYCKACGQELSFDSNAGTYIHTNSGCENFGKNVAENPDLFTNDPGDGGGTENSKSEAIPDDKKSGAQKFFENFVFENAFDMGSANGSGFTPSELLDKTFVYAIAILEGTDHVPSGYIDTENIPFSSGVVHEDWYIFLQAVAMIIMLIRFCYDYATVRVWTPASPQTPEQMFRPIFRLICGFVLIFAAHYILAVFLYISQGACNAFSDNILGDTTATEQTFEQVKIDLCTALGFQKDSIVNMPANLGACLFGFLTLVIPMILNMVYTVFMFSTIISRVLEIILRGIMVPLSMSDVYEDHGGNAMRYAMEFAAVCFQGVLILMSIWVSNVVCAFIIENVITLIPDASVGNYLKAIGSIGLLLAGVKLAQIILLTKTRTIAQSAFAR